MMKKFFTIVFVLVVVTFALAFAKDFIIKSSVESAVRVVTGLSLEIQKMKVGIVNTLVSIEDLRLYNPSGYQDRVMLDMPEIYVDYDLGSILKGTIHLYQVRLDLREFVVVKNKDGKLNLDSLNVVKDKGKAQKPENTKKTQFQIDEFQLKIGKVTYKDYSKGGKPAVQEFNIELNEKFTNINDPAKLMSLIVVRALVNTSIAQLSNFDLGTLKGTIGETLDSAQKLLGELPSKEVMKAVDKAKGALAQSTQTVDNAKAAVEETAAAAKKAAEDLKKSIPNPFAVKK
ncbi:MAG: hypothetical protein HQL30_11150 [Candidatus Omnitrophica bacterium]|nr:hypothetical protein [Candidatus Omnitrophota bacterium]